MSLEDREELLLAQEQSVVNKASHRGFKGDLEGTLILTQKRLIFVCARETTKPSPQPAEDQPLSAKVALETSSLGMNLMGGTLNTAYSDVNDLSDLPADPKNLSIPLSAISSISGHRGVMGPPKLKVEWRDSISQRTESTEFVELLTEGRKKKDLSDWAPVIERLKAGSLSLEAPKQLPQQDSLEGRIYYVMGDLQTKGSLQIEQETEHRFGIELIPEEVEAACQKLVSMGLLVQIPGEAFFKRHSPLGEDDLSS